MQVARAIEHVDLGHGPTRARLARTRPLDGADDGGLVAVREVAYGRLGRAVHIAAWVVGDEVEDRVDTHGG